MIDCANDGDRFTLQAADDGGGEENVSVAAKSYKDPYELAAAIQTAMNAATADNITVSYDDVAGKYTIASDGVTLSLLWNTGTNTAETIGAKLGYSVAADDTGATSYEADNVISKASITKEYFYFTRHDFCNFTNILER